MAAGSEGLIQMGRTMWSDPGNQIPNHARTHGDNDECEYGVAGKLRRRLCQGPEHGTIDLTGKPLAPERVRALIEARKLRRNFFSADLLGEPAWDMLLYLFVKELEQKRARILDLCLASGIGQTAAMRWIRALENENLVTSCGGQFDDGTEWIELSALGSAAMRGYLRRIL